MSDRRELNLEALMTAEEADMAACRGMDTEIFFPPRGTPPAEIRAAKLICHDCIVRQACFDESLYYDYAGIKAGFSARQRREIKKEGWDLETSAALLD